MASHKRLLVAAAMALVATAALLPAAAAKRFTVGDAEGWATGVDYVAWANGKKFRAGDILVFVIDDPSQDVVQVDQKSFASCSTPDNARVLSSGSSIAVKLKTPGKFFFISEGEGACESGMKLTINVVH